MIHIHTDTTPTLGAARHISELLKEYQGRDVLFLISGGSVLAVLEHVDTTLLSKHTTVSVLDERYTHDDATSNFSQLTNTTFWERATKQHVQAVDPRPHDDESLEDTARRFDTALTHWHAIHHTGVCIALMGVGIDEHTAGILPLPNDPETFRERFIKTNRKIIGYRVDPHTNPHTERMTVSCAYLTQHVHHAMVYMTGQEKSSALRALVAPTGDLHTTPARVLQMMPMVYVFTNITLELPRDTPIVSECTRP